MSDLGEIMLKRELDALTTRVEALEKRKKEEQELWVSVGHQIISMGDD